MIFVTADTHFGHHRVLQYGKRPFKDVERMDEELIHRWNQWVQPLDEVYHLGDVSFHKPDITALILERINGRIYLVRGNHDKTTANQCSARFEWIKDYHVLKHEKKRYVLMHYPLLTWDRAHYGTFDHNTSAGRFQQRFLAASQEWGMPFHRQL